MVGQRPFAISVIGWFWSGERLVLWSRAMCLLCFGYRYVSEIVRLPISPGQVMVQSWFGSDAAQPS